MTINTGQYCLVDTSGPDQVLQGPQLLPANYVGPDGTTYTNINNTDVWNDTQLIAIGWYPYRIIDAGPPEPPPKQYNRSLGPFVIAATEVTQTAIYTEFTQQEYDLAADTTLTDSQRVAQDLARQTERHIGEDDYRLLASRPPLIPPVDRADVQEYLGTLYDAVDDPNIPPNEPPGATRQITDVPGEAFDRAAIRRYEVEFGGFTYYEIEYTLYTSLDATGMSLWIELQSGTYLFTLVLQNQGNGVWSARTDRNAGMANTDSFRVALYKNVKISQDFDLPPFGDPAYPLIFDVRWLDESLQSKIASGQV